MDRQLLKQKLSAEFYTQLYRWSIEDAYREASNGFPFLSRMRHIYISYYLRILKSSPSLEQVKIFVALTKSSYQSTGEFSQANITSEEKRLLSVFQQKLNKLPIYRTDIIRITMLERVFLK